MRCLVVRGSLLRAGKAVEVPPGGTSTEGGGSIGRFCSLKVVVVFVGLLLFCWFVLEGVDVGGILTYVLVNHSNLMGKIR